jgi:hypothetical protein
MRRHGSLTCDRYYLGLILHVYNTLLQCGFVKKEDMPVLEDLCELFNNEVFVGCRNAPKRKLSHQTTPS